MLHETAGEVVSSTSMFSILRRLANDSSFFVETFHCYVAGMVSIIEHGINPTCEIGQAGEPVENVEHTE